MSFFIALRKNNEQLNAPRHKSIAKIGLDCSGRLLPGFMFDGFGNVSHSLQNLEKKPLPKRKKRLSDSCNEKCEPCEDKKPTVKYNPNVNKSTLEKAKKLDGFKKKVIKKSEPVKVEVKATQKNIAPNVFNLNLSDITIDKARFQNRDKLNQLVLDEIVNNYSATKLDPVIVWIDPKDKKTYLLAGHHRYEGTRLLGKKTIAAKYETGTESEMIYYAKFESNANRSLETPIERAKIYREMRLSGVTKTKITELAKKTEPKANYVIALSYLDPNGLVISSLNALQNTDKQNQSIIETIAEWIGTAKSTQTLTAAHEKEMFAFLMDKETSKRITTKANFVQKIAAICGGFDFDINKPLNLKRFKNETIGETAYDEEFKELKNKLDKAIDNKANLKARISDPKNPDFIKPTDKDYKNILVALDVAIIKHSNEIAFYQKQIIELTRNKGKYTNAGSNQIGLFAKGLDFIVNEPAPETVVIVENNNKNSLANRIANRPAVQEYFNIYCKQIRGFLGNIERKTKESVFISLTGGRGSMKTRMCFQFMNAFAQNYKVGHASIEEHPESSLYFDKAAEYLNQTALNNIEAPEIRTLQDLHELIMRNDVIVIDSYTKMKEIFKGFEVDKDLRKKYNGKLFIVIFQQTTSGAMRGGSKSEYDADIVLFTEKKDNYEKNYIYADKNRYNGQIGLTYNIFHKRLDGLTTIVAPKIKQKFKVN